MTYLPKVEIVYTVKINLIKIYLNKESLSYLFILPRVVTMGETALGKNPMWKL
jgi:hypothetical protein